MTTPYGYQVEAVGGIERFGGRCLLAADPGLGKSYISLSWAYQHPEVRPFVIVCPAHLRWHWERECKVHLNMRAEILEGMKPTLQGLRKNKQIIIINYDILKGWMKFLLSIDPKLVIFDECQALLSRKSLRTRQSRLLAKKIPHVLALSGTPLTNRPSELWPTLNMLRPDEFPSFWAYAQAHCAAKRTFWGWDVSGASNLDVLHSTLLKTCMLRYRKADVLPDLPKKRRFVVPLEISDKKEYDKALNDFIGWLTERNPSKLNGAEKATRLVQIGYLLRLTAKLKSPAVVNWIDDFLANSNEKLICFGIHREKSILEKLHKRYGNISIQVNGKIIGRKRQLAFDEFRTNKKCRLFLGNIRAGGTGWSATGVARVAFVELGWTPGEHVQGEDRTHGLNRGIKGERSEIYYLVGKSTIEEHLLKVIQRKQRILNQTLDGKKKSDELDVFDELCRVLLQEKAA